MRFKQDGAVFRPVTITLETQEEADVLTAALALVASEEVSRFAYNLYRALDEATPNWADRFRVKTDGDCVRITRREV